MTLEDKIVSAKKLGLKFEILPAGQGLSGAMPNTMQVVSTWTDKMFEDALDKVLAKFHESTYLGLLSKHKLI